MMGKSSKKRSQKKSKKVESAAETPSTEKESLKSERDFAAQGVQDDVKQGSRPLGLIEDEAIDDTEEENEGAIAYGVDDKSDPFKQEVARVAAQTVKDQLGREIGITPDKAVRKTLLEAGPLSGRPDSLAADGDKVRVHYVGRLESDGKQFDSSYDRGEPFEFTLGEGKVIRGWEEALRTMAPGEKARFVIDPAYAYGIRGVPPVIPSSATLEFEIELVEIAPDAVVSSSATKEMEEETEKAGGSSSRRNSASDSAGAIATKRVEKRTTFADDNPDVERTPASIAGAYEKRMEEKKTNKEKVGFFDRFYFISPFASQTGEKPPWWLNPRITFSIVFLSVAVAFYIVLKAGALHQGYVEPVDVSTMFK